MRKRMLSMLMAIIMTVGLLPGFLQIANAEVGSPKTANEAVGEMSWGVNLVDLYIAEPEEDLRRSESTTGYIDYEAKESYDLSIGMWFWDNSFEWVCTYPTEKQDTIQISIPIPDYDAAIAEANEGWAFFVVRCGGKTGGNDYKITLSDCKITAKDGTVLKDTYNFGSNWDGVLTAEGTTSTEADNDGWYWGYGSQENNWTGEIGYFAGEWDANTNTMGHGADPKYNGATFTATLTVDTAKMLPIESKAEHYYCINRTESDYRALVDTYMSEGVNVFRLPVTWTWFVQNDGEFAIDTEWLEMIKGTVDYILSKGAYCILDTHNDYLQYSYVAESDGNGGYTNFHWEDQWMQAQYKDYVDARFAAIWTQIANYFKDYPDHLIFEACNEPAMLWYSGVNYDLWIAQQEQRVNELNEIFVNTVRATGGKNETRILCLAVAEYNIHTHLGAITLPEDSDYLMIQVHSYNEMENTSNGETWTQATDDLFRDIAAFQARCPKVPVIVGEVGISHSYQNINNPADAANKVSYFFEKAEGLGVPCLWWEDYFMVPEGGATTIFWIYNKVNGEWRTEILDAIKNALSVTETDPTVLLTGVEITNQPRKTEYAVGERFEPAGMVVTAVYSDNSRKDITGYTYTPAGTLTEDDTLVTVSYTEGGVTKTATVSIAVYAADLPCDHIDRNKDHNCDLCGEKLSDCGDTKPADHKCDLCKKVLSTCADKNEDGKCDVCGAITVPAKPYKIANVISGVHVYWKTVPGAVKYGLWRSETGKNGTYKWIANPTVPHFTDTKVESGKTYYYKVTSMDAAGNHSEKSEAIGVTYVATPDITSRFNKAAGITVGWNKIQGATGYAIYRKSYSGTDAWVRVGTVSGNSTFTWQDTSVKNENGEIYRYTVRALAGSDMKTLSGCRNTGRTMARLTSRVLNSAVKASATSIKCSWTTSSVVTGYEVRFMVGSTVYKTFTVGNYKTGVKTFTGLKAGQTYKIQVRSYLKVDGMGFYSAWSEAKNVTLP